MKLPITYKPVVTQPISQRTKCPDGTQTRLENPTISYLELTAACDSRCPGCINESFIADFKTRQVKHEFRQRLQTAMEWFAVLDRLPATVNMIILSGGEPTLHPEFLDFVQELNRRELNFVVFSNGRWTDPDRLLTVLKNLAWFRGFLISLHGANPQSHDAFMGVRGAFSQTVENIRRASQAGLQVSVSTVLTRENLKELIDVTQLAFNLGVEEISFNRYLLTPARLEETRGRVHPLSPLQLQQAIAQIEELRSVWSDQLRIGYGPCIPQCFAPSASTGCSAGTASIVIDPWGNLKPCLHTDLLVGNISQNTFDDLWHSSPLEAWRHLYDSSCPSCSAFDQCGGGCRAMTLAYGLGRDPLMAEPLVARSDVNHFIALDLIPVVA